MKVSIDGILGSAKQIKKQRQVEDESRERKENTQVKTDSFKIENKVSLRLDSIQRELKEIQTSLTKNQTIREGLNRLKVDFSRGGQNIDKILDEVSFEGARVLRDFTGDNIIPSTLNTKIERINALINSDIDNLTRLQIEVENILASSVASSDKADDIMKNVESAFARSGRDSMNSISNLRADAVMRLIK